MGCATVLPLLLVASLALLVAGQDTKPAAFPFDCRRSTVNCQNSGLCHNENGACTCATDGGFEGYDCSLQTSLKAEPCTANQCENNGECLTDNACFCDADTYGAKCQNPRVKMWCTDTEMFININPHTSSFSGKIYLRKGENREGRDETLCQLKAVISGEGNSSPDLTQYTYVKTVNNEVPTLEGFYFVQAHENAEGAENVCIQSATKQTDNETGRVDYLQEVIIEYSNVVVSSVDQRVIFNCSVLPQVTGTPFTSENALAVDLFDNDYAPVNVTDTIAPVLFEIRDPDAGVITSNIHLGDPMDLTFTLQISADAEPTNTTIVDFKVTDCVGTDGQEGSTANITFLTGDCPAPGSEMLYRAQVTKDTEGTQRKTVIPLRAFRFVGDYDSVAFLCTLTLCSKSMVDAGSTDCVKSACPGDPEPEPEGGESENNQTTTAAPTAAPAAESEAGSSRRKKREAPVPDVAQVNQTVKVISRYDSGLQTGSNNNNDNEEEGETAKTTKDCMQQSEVVILIVIFAVIFVVLLVALVVTVINLLRSRKKVVGVPSCGASMAAESNSHYSLPRLSLNTNM